MLHCTTRDMACVIRVHAPVVLKSMISQRASERINDKYAWIRTAIGDNLDLNMSYILTRHLCKCVCVNTYTKGQVIYKFLILGDFALGLRKLPQSSPEIVPYDQYAAAYLCTIRHHASSAHILCPPREAPARIRY